MVGKTLKEAPKDEISKNVQLLIRAGFIFKEMAGVYSYLPLGLKVLKKIEGIIREEMNAIGGSETKTSILQTKEIWEKSGRWDDGAIYIWLKTKLKNGTEVGLSFTNEEAHANILRQYVSSYKDLPVYPYDFKEIFRNEARSKSGMLRAREFYWKALYSFSRNEAEHNEFYEKARQAYQNIFDRAGIGGSTYLTFASGGSFSKYSHEFQTLTEAGEDTIYVDEKKRLAVNQEVYTDEILQNLGLNKNELVEKKAIEVGNIFTLGTKFSEPFGLKYTNEQGEKKPVFMGSYGIGLGRLMGTIVEVFSDEKGIAWPESVAPAKFHLISLNRENEKVKTQAEKVYKFLLDSRIEVLYDDREDATAGEKFSDADLIGIPYRVVISEKTGDQVELKKRVEKEARLVVLEELLNL